MSGIRAIEFENNRFKVCYSGQLLQGKVKLFFPAETHVKAIYIAFVGRGHCKWYAGKNRRSECLTGTKTYLEEKIYLLRRSNDMKDTRALFRLCYAIRGIRLEIANMDVGVSTFGKHADYVLPAGDNNFPFSIQLSTKLPTSYEGTYGYVRYAVALHIERSVQKIEPLRESFTVIRPLNLNNQTLFRMPVEKRVCATFNQFCFFFCWKTSALKIFARLPVSGYCPGQTMNLKLDMINNSDKEVLHLLVHFIKVVTYRSNNGCKKIERVLLAERRADGCRADRNGIKSTKVNITVPSLPPTNFSTENICGFHYLFRVTAVTGFCHRNPKFQIPVVIGTYPISDELYSDSINVLNYEQSSRNVQTESNVLSAMLRRNPSNMSLNSTVLPPYPDADPPTYEEAIRAAETTNDNFVPKYPTYKRGTKYANQDLNNC